MKKKTHPKSYILIFKIFVKIFEIKNALIKESGRGVFALENIRQNKIILLYKGKRLSSNEYFFLYPNQDGKYVLEIKEKNGSSYFIDAKDEPLSSYAHIINDAKNSGVLPNVQFTKTGYIKTIKKIKKGDELLLDYGSEYNWD